MNSGFNRMRRFLTVLKGLKGRLSSSAASVARQVRTGVADRLVGDESNLPDMFAFPAEDEPLRKAKVADRPHATTIALSTLALLVSLSSIFISWRALQVNRASARAVVEITQLRYRLAELPQGFWKAPDVLKAQKFFKDHPPILEGTITNFGKTRALNVKVTGQIRFWDTYCNGVALLDSFSVPDLAPGRTQNAYVKPNMYALLSPVPDNIRISGFLDYTDEATGAVYHESWCYQSMQTKPVVEFAFCSADAPPGPTLEKAPKK